MRGSIWAIAAVVTLLAAGCGATTTANPTAPSVKATASDPGAQMSKLTTAYMDKTMPKLAKITQLWKTGDLAKMTEAAKLWKSIKTVIWATPADKVASDDYLAYANNLRYYMVGDGSVNLKQLEASRDKAEATIADLRP